MAHLHRMLGPVCRVIKTIKTRLEVKNFILYRNDACTATSWAFAGFSTGFAGFGLRWIAIIGDAIALADWAISVAFAIGTRFA